MEWITLSIVAVLINCLLGYFLYRSNNQLSNVKTQLGEFKNVLTKAKEKEHYLSTQLKESREKYSKDSMHDSLTGLIGRQMFEDRLLQTINLSKRNQLPFAVLFLDLDGFKVINSALGHDVGDELVKEIAKKLQASIRSVDTISRFSADQFIFILFQLAKPESSAIVAQRLLDAISHPINLHGNELYVTASIGIAIYPSDGETPKELMKNADTALHQAKIKGRNLYHFYRAEMQKLSRRELKIVSTLQNPAISKEFVIYYQPIIDIESKKLICMQAVLYWEHPDFGLITLNDFLQWAENDGKIIEIGEWILRNALQQFSEWKSTDTVPHAIAIPVSSRQLENSRFASKLSQIIQEVNVDPNDIILEISERSLPSQLDLVEKIFNMLKHVGIKISLKDFGTGHLSLQYFKRLPIDYIKIADLIVQGITIDKDNEAIVKMIASLGKSLQIPVIADAVDTQQQKELLKELKCNIMQGNLFSAPLLPNEFTGDMVESLSAK